MAAENCVDKKNLGVTRCTKFPGPLKAMIITPPGFSLTPAEALVITNWQNALQDVVADRIYLLPEFDKIEDVSTESVYDEGINSDILADQGKYRFRAMINAGLCMHKNMTTHSGKGDRVFLIDKKNQIIGTEMANGNIRGFKLGLLNTEKIKISDGSVGTFSPVYFVLKDETELSKKGLIVDAQDFVNELQSIVDVTLELVGSVSSSTIVVDAFISCDEDTPLTGLVAADFLLLTDAGAAQTKTLAESTTVPGRYTLTAGTTFVDGTVTLVPSASLSVDAYEAGNTLTVNVP